MKPILVIAPHTKIEHEAKKIASHHHDVEVKLALLDQSLEIVAQAEKEGVEAIISRGGTAKIIRKSLGSLPVIEIQVSPYDLLHAIYVARKHGRNICIIGFRNIIEGVQLLHSILDVNINVYLIEHEEDGEKHLKQIIHSGKRIDALLGGAVAEKLALKYGIPTVPLETGSTAIDLSIQEARRIIEVTRKEKKKTEEFKAILHYINEAVVSIDSHKKITTFNPAAGKMAGISDVEVIGRPIEEIIPNTRLDKIMETNTPELGEVYQIGKSQVLINRVPIVLRGKTLGAVATFQDITKIQEYEQRIRAKLLAKGHVAKYSFSKIIGESKALLEAKEKAKKYASNDSTVLIVGESGTGKEMFAQSIHLDSRRNKGPFVAVNCAAIPQNLLESELFGYEEGAFTGAKKVGKTGLFIEAHKGTIFLDEIAEIPIELQAMLLRVLQEREVRPVGSNKVIPIDIRIIAATNKNLLQEVEKGNFREDLYYRLNILKLRVPTLRERKNDVTRLSKYFVDKISTKYNKFLEVSPKALELLESYDWPGNIRELENIIERLVVLNDDIITEEATREIFDEQAGGNPYSWQENHEDVDSLEEVKKKHIYKILTQCNGNQTLAASKLGISRTHLWRIMNNDKNKKN